MWRRNTAQRRGVWGGGGGTNALSATLVNHVIHVHAKLKFPVDNFFLGAFITWVAISGPYLRLYYTCTCPVCKEGMHVIIFSKEDANTIICLLLFTHIKCSEIANSL